MSCVNLDDDDDDVTLNPNYVFADKRSLVVVYEGLQEDAEMFCRKFLNSQNLSFASFANLWKELKFPSIFACRIFPSELMEFTDGLIHFGKAYLFAKSLNLSLFGLYFIYSVCHKQTNKYKSCKLRLTLGEVEHLSKILQNLHERGYIDAQYIFKSLHQSGCISYVATPLEVGMEEGFKKYFGSTDEGQPQKPKPSKPLDTSALDTLETITKLYSDMKMKVCGDKQLFLSDDDFAAKVRQKLESLKNIEKQEKEPAPEEDQTGAHRRELKKKAHSKTQSEENIKAVPQPRTAYRRRKTKMTVVTEEAQPEEAEGPKQTESLPTID